MKSFTIQFLLAQFPQYLFAGTSNALESRYGVSFSSTTIVASGFNSNGSIDLTAVPASSDYRALYTQAVNRYQVSDDYMNEFDVKSAFEVSVAPIVEILTEQTGQAPEIATLFLPSVFDQKTRVVAADAIFANAQYVTARAESSRRGACYIYGFLEGKNLGRPVSECNGNGPSSLVLLFEYENEYLYGWLVEVELELDIYVTQQNKMCKECGEGHREAYQERVNTFVHDFIEIEVLAKNSREDIRAIIIVGETSATGAKELRKAALDAVGMKDVKLMTDYKPSQVVAHAAAALARLTEEHPEDFTVVCAYRIPDEVEWALEAAQKALRG